MSGKSFAIINIGELTTNTELGVLHDAAVLVQGAEIVWVGESHAAPVADETVDAGGRAVLPGWVDSHTHLLFAGDRTKEFEARMAGQRYEAGGINVTVQATRAATDAELEANLVRLIGEANRGGTTTIETKTGYGLTVFDELRAAKIAKRHADAVTFLGAHVVPAGQDPATYLDSVTTEMLDAVAPYIDFVDVFCETGAFDEAQTRRVLEAAKAKGIQVRLHANQLDFGPGIRLGVEYGAKSVDHLGFVSQTDIELLAKSKETVATVLPACDLSTRMPLAPARTLLDAGVPVAIATNCNPGTSYTTSMDFAVATAVLQMRLSVAEAVKAATDGGAIALGLNEARHGRLPIGKIAPGYSADMQLLDAPSVTHIAYRPGSNLPRKVFKAGRRLV